MKDSERISNLEEMSAEILMRLDRAEAQLEELRKSRTQTTNDISSLDQSIRELAKYTFRVEERQGLVENAMSNLTALQKSLYESLLTKEDMDRLFEFTMRRFDKVDMRFAKIDKRMDDMSAETNNWFKQVTVRLDKMDEHFDDIDKRLENLGKLNDKDQPDSSQS